MELSEGRIVGVSGIDTSLLGRALNCEPLGEGDLIAEALALAAANEIPEATAMGAAKVLFQDHLRKWLLDPDRRLDLVDGMQELRPTNSISATHAFVELILSDPDGATTAAVLPSLDVLLRRADGFLDLYAPLGLAEEADLIVAKITGQRTAEEIAARSPHEHDDIVKLLAALTASGMLEAVHAAMPDTSPVLIVTPDPSADLDRQSSARRLSPLLVLAAVVIVAAAAIGTWWFVFRQDKAPPQPETTGHWAVAVDLGCEPHEFRRLLQVARRYDDVRPVALTGNGEDGDGTCWRLVWGDFPTMSQAESAISSVPASICREGFEPHVVEVDEGADIVEDGG
ncbi:MAG: hypothetical protein DRJ65_09255 [Acidobacteria bacterium]|nr:MAG: hypothetical protein DRJ65_09255 [Acidobacteriota bacterium]